ncbi:MAG TPA: fluoride efflux transporter CrcB [Solirubrobacteraceae bacterium]|nr:fluoride efflux transporter CrcB [Solirubrobacteraceae bacterium]
MLQNPDRRELAAIFIGGAGGALLRVWIGRELGGAGDGWPWATFLINVAGSLLLGYLVTRLQERLPQSTYPRPLLCTGFCGAFTTFSTMQVEILKMLEYDHYALAAGYAGASVALGYLALGIATAAVRRTRAIA